MKPCALPKSLIVSGRQAVGTLLEKGRGGVSGCIRYKWFPREELFNAAAPEAGAPCHQGEGDCHVGGVLEEGRCHIGPCPEGECHIVQAAREDKSPSRIMVSVPKKIFRRAVKRNLLKRRMREAFRLQKNLVGPGLDIIFVYISRGVLPYADIYADMTAALTSIAKASGAIATDDKSLTE